MKTMRYMMTCLSSLFILCLFGFSCQNVSKEKNEDIDSVAVEDDNVFAIRKFVVSKTSNGMQIYQSPSKTALRLISEVDETGEYAEQKWGNLSEYDEENYVEERNFLPVIGETNDWYKVYVDLEGPCGGDVDDVFLGFVPKSDCKVASIKTVNWNEAKDDWFWHEEYICIRQDLGYYVKWGIIECSGEALVIGKVENGIVMETDIIDFVEDQEASRIIIGDLEFTNPNYLKTIRNYECQIATDINKFSDADFKKIISLAKDSFPRIGVKANGVESFMEDGTTPLEWINIGKTINNHKIVLDLK